MSSNESQAKFYYLNFVERFIALCSGQQSRDGRACADKEQLWVSLDLLGAPARETNVGRLEKVKKKTYAAAARKKTTKRLILLILICDCGGCKIRDSFILVLVGIE